MVILGLGILYLYMKTIERAHTPKHMWERIKLSNNYSKALEQASGRLVLRGIAPHGLTNCIDR
jgi:hypothetical protein